MPATDALGQQGIRQSQDDVIAVSGILIGEATA
jgi:hypothetical protein